MEVRWLFQELQYPTVDSNRRKSNHLTNTRSFPRTQGLGFLDYKDPLQYAQYSRWEREPFQGTSLCHFRIRGTKKKKISRASREKICHPQRMRILDQIISDQSLSRVQLFATPWIAAIPTYSKQWPCRDNGATNPKSWRKDLHQTTDLLWGQTFSDRQELLGPLLRRNKSVYFTKTQEGEQGAITSRIQIQLRREAGYP